MAVVILIGIVFYIAQCVTGLYYVLKVRKYDDINAKLKFMDRTLGVFCLEQALAIVAIIIFYAVRLKDVHIEIPDWWAIVSAVIDFGGFVAVRTFWFFHSRKHFPKSEISEIKEEKLRRMRDYFHNMSVILAAMAFVNFGFNLLLGGAVV